MKGFLLAAGTIGLAGLAVLAGALVANRGASPAAIEPSPAPRAASVPARPADRGQDRGQVALAPSPNQGQVALAPSEPSTQQQASGGAGRVPAVDVGTASDRDETEPARTRVAGGSAVTGGAGFSPSAPAAVGASGGSSGSGSGGGTAAAGYAVGNVVASAGPSGGSTTPPRPEPQTNGTDNGTKPSTDGDGTKSTPPPKQTGPALVRLVPDAARAAVGQRVTVHVFVDNATDVTSVPFHLAYDPAVLKFESSAKGAFLSSDGHSATVLVAPTLSGNVVVFGAARLGPGPGISGSGEIASLAFRVVGSGSTLLAISDASVWNSQNETVPATFQPASISAN